MIRDPDYASYLLRLRKVQHCGQATWITSAQSVTTSEVRTFPHIEALVTFLLAEYGSQERTRAPPIPWY